MSQAPVYTPSTDFSDYQLSNPSAPFSGTLLDVEFADLATTTQALGSNAALIQRDDGLLKNKSVHLDALSDAVLLLIGSLGWIPRGAWVTATTYAAKDLVSFTGVPYVAVTTHVSGTFAADLAAGKWLALDTSLPVSSVVSKSAGFNLVAADRQTLFLCTGSFTVTADAAAAIGVGWEVQFRNGGVGVITIDPNASEQVDGTASVRLYPGDACFLECTGTGFITHGVKRVTHGFEAISSNRNLVVADYGKTFVCSGSITITLDSAAVLLTQWYVDIKNTSTGIITIDPTGSETIGGAQTLSLASGESCRLYCVDSISFDVYHRTFTGMQSVRDLVCANDAGTPNTLWNINFSEVTLRNAGAQGTFRYGAAASLVNNVAAAGPTANGRDQAGAFSANSWIHFYVIWGAGALSTVSSASATSPTLPLNYTHFAYVGAVRFNGSSQLVRTRIQGDTAYYEAETSVATFTATAETAVSTAAAVPPNASGAYVAANDYSVTSDGGGALAASLTLRLVTGVRYAYFVNTVLSGLAASNAYRAAAGIAFWIPNLSQSFLAIWVVTAGSAQTAGLYVLAYRLPILAS